MIEFQLVNLVLPLVLINKYNKLICVETVEIQMIEVKLI
jgi:hypothetical protein